MFWVHLIMVLALFQYLLFGTLVSRARGTYGVKAPATTGHEVFERFYRVQMNTLELLVVLLPALWVAANYWNPALVAAAGGVYLVGRMIYLRAYVKEPSTRALGFLLSIFPVIALLAVSLIGMGMRYLQGGPF